MVSFRNLIVSALALAAPIAAQASPADVVKNIQTITQKSQALQAPAQSINLINGPLILIGMYTPAQLARDCKLTSALGQGPFPQM